MKVSPGGSSGALARGRENHKVFLHPHCLRVYKILFLKPSSSVWVSPPPHFVSTTEAAFLFEQKKKQFVVVGSCHLPKFWGKKPKATTKVTLTSHQSVEREFVQFCSIVMSRRVWQKYQFLIENIEKIIGYFETLSKRMWCGRPVICSTKSCLLLMGGGGGEARYLSNLHGF